MDSESQVASRYRAGIRRIRLGDRGGLVGNDGPVSDGNFVGGNDTLPTARAVTPPADGEFPNCDGACQSYCDGLTLENPVNRGLCSSLWGVGLDHKPIDVVEACRRLYVDMVGRYPTEQEVADNCEARPWGTVVRELIDSAEFNMVNRRRYADVFLYNTQAVSLERIYDMDRLVDKFIRGHVSYDVFAQVVSAHPVVVRRFAEPEDMAAEAFQLLIGRPPFDHERIDLARLYALWAPGYYNHRPLNMRLPDSAIQYRCVDEYGRSRSGDACRMHLDPVGYARADLAPRLAFRGGGLRRL